MLCPRFVRGCPRLSAVVRGSAGYSFRLSAVVRGLVCFVAFLLSADVRGWEMLQKRRKKRGQVVRGCPRLSCDLGVVRCALVRGLSLLFL